MKVLGPRLSEQRPGFPGEEGAEREARAIDNDLSNAVHAHRQQAHNRLDGHMPAPRLDGGR